MAFFESKIISFEKVVTVRANTSVSSGKWYWEITIENGQYWNSSLSCVGVGTASVLPRQAFANTIYGWGIDCTGKTRHGYSEALQKLPMYRNSNLMGKVAVGIALDMDNGYLWGIVADEWGRYDYIGNPVTGDNPHITGIIGTVYPMVSLEIFESEHSKNFKITANFGKEPFVHGLPSGFNVLIGPSSSSSSLSSSSSYSSSSY